MPATEVVPAPPERCHPLTGYPEGSWLNYVSWSPEGTTIAFTVGGVPHLVHGQHVEAER